MNTKSPWLFVPAMIILVLLTLSSYLLSQNKVYARKNRELLLQNDSVLSVNLDLMNELERLRKTGRP